MAIPQLWPHQKQSLAFYRTHDIVYDASDPGTGKTAVCLTEFAERRRAGGGRALLVAPLSLLGTTWADDIAKFAPELTLACAYAPDERRLEAFAASTDIVGINTDAVRWLDAHNRLLKGFDTVIIDEVTYYKHRTSIRSRAMANLNFRFKIFRALSGTPRAGSITDLWNQVRVLDNGARLGADFKAFQRQVCDPEEGPFGITWVDKPGINRPVFYLLRDIMIRHEFDKVMDVPSNYTRKIRFDLPQALYDKYLELEEYCVLELERRDITAVNAAVLRNKLLQLCSGAVYYDRNEYQVLDDARYNLIMDLVAGRDATVVFFNWRHQRDQLVGLAKKRGISHAVIDGRVTHRNRTKVVESFQAGDQQVLFLQPETGAHGLTLTRGTTTIWSSPQYKPDIQQQGLHRIYRGGQTKKTETILIEANDTVESIVFEKLMGKTEGMLDLLKIIADARGARA